jgi:CRP-like cAMP-binding protein
MPRDVGAGAPHLWVTIPRTEEVYEKHLGKSSSRTTFILEVRCTGLAAAAGAGSTQSWTLQKRYGYFERVQKVAAKCAAEAKLPVPTLPRRKFLNHRDPKYLAELREQLQQYMEVVVDLVCRSADLDSDGLEGVLQILELPVATSAAATSATWEQGGHARFGASAGGKAQPVALEGQLRKQGGSKRGKERGWKERWFVLTGSSLHYYSYRDAPSTKGVIELASGWVGEASAHTSALPPTAFRARYPLNAGEALAHTLHPLPLHIQCPVPTDGVARSALQVGEASAADAEELRDGRENYLIVLKLAGDGREVRLAADSMLLRAEWVSTLSASVSLPPSPPPPPGTRDKRIAQLETTRVQNKLLAQEASLASAARTLTTADENDGGPTRLQLLSHALDSGRAWRGFDASELTLLLEVGGLTVQRFTRHEKVMRIGEAATFFGVVLQGSLAVYRADVGDKATPQLKYSGDVLGEFELFHGGLRTADVVATADGFVATMNYAQLEALKTSAQVPDDDQPSPPLLPPSSDAHHPCPPMNHRLRRSMHGKSPSGSTICSHARQ